jgi:hypothetical protein
MGDIISPETIPHLTDDELRIAWEYATDEALAADPEREPERLELLRAYARLISDEMERRGF